MKKRGVVIALISIVLLLTIIAFATYAYFGVANLTTTNVVNMNTVTERNNMVFDTMGGDLEMLVRVGNMMLGLSGNLAAENNTTLTVNFQANSPYNVVCTYDIIYEWTSSQKYQAHTSGVSSEDLEFTIQGNLANNAHVYQGNNSIASETDLVTAVGNQNSATVVSGAQIDSSGSTTNTAVWTITSKFYNLDEDQTAMAGNHYTGRFKVGNVSCIAGTVDMIGPTSYWYATDGSYTFPSHGGTLQTSGSATGHNVYIGQDNSKYYTCANDGNNHEACFAFAYTRYGLSDHTLNDDFTSAQQASARDAVYQVFSNSGMNVDINNCGANVEIAYCYVGYVGCEVRKTGHIFCKDDYEHVGCGFGSLGGAGCQSY